MTVDTMRTIDFYAGVPLCALASLWLKLLRLFGLGPNGSRPKKVLFLQLSEMGSAIIGDASLRFAQKEGLDTYYAIFKKNSACLRLIGTIPEDHIYRIRDDNFWIFTFDSLNFLLWTRKNNIDAIIDFELFSRFSALLTAFSGARERIGFYKYHTEGLYRGEILTKKVSYNPHMHIAKNFMALVKTMLAAGGDVPNFKGEILDSEIQPMKVKISGEAQARVRSVLNEHAARAAQMKWVIFNCAGGEFLPQRRWPPMYYAKLAQIILDRHADVGIVLTGSPDEFQELEPIRTLASRDRCINLAGRIKFDDLTALYSLSRLMVSNDSGPAHFASLTDLPTYVFFGPETPKLYGAIGNFTALYANYSCSPCVSAFNHRKTPCNDNKCLQAISAESVYAKIAQLLS